MCDVFLDVPYHQQDTNKYCGPACAQMVLHSPSSPLPDQPSLWDTIQAYPSAETSSWMSKPDSLCAAVNASLPPGSVPYHLHAVSSEEVLTRKIIWSMHQYQRPAIVAKSGDSHWIVVRGFKTDVAPASASDTSYNIISLDINSPGLDPDPPPPPHSDADPCGTGGVYGETVLDVSYSQWKDAYLYPVPKGKWAGKYLAICDPDPPPLAAGEVVTTATPEKGDQIVTEARARALAIAAMAQYELDKRKSWEPFLRGAKPAAPFLVQHLGRADSFYYIVPMQTKKAVPVLVNIDARFGSYLEAGRTKDPHNNALAGLNFDPDWARQQLLGRKVDLRKGGRLTIRKEAFALYPTLVWRPCRESQSPFIPFFMATVGTQRVYLRVDGQLFTRLHTSDVA